MSGTGTSEDEVLKFLKSNPNTLENLVVGPLVSSETFERWTTRRAIRIRKNKKEVPSGWMDADHTMKRRMILENSDNRNRMLYELAQCCGQMLGTESMELIIQNDDGGFTCKKSEDGELILEKAKKSKKATHVQNIVNCGNQTIGELHFFTSLTDFEKSIVNVVCTWCASTIYYAEFSKITPDMVHWFRVTITRDSTEWLQNSDILQISTHAQDSDTVEIHENIARQQKLSNFLLDVAKSIFHDIVSMDAVVMKVMNYAQKLVDADRASLFLVDGRNQQIYARIFDVGTEGDEHTQLNNDGQKEIRFDMVKGIAGYVASTGEGLNIENAYEDERFNAEVDSKTGYTTKTILCMPILIRGTVIGVVQMVNKHVGVFTKQDEENFQIFAVYCGLALHHAKLYDKIRRSEQKYRVALEVLAYHSVCNKDEVNKLKKIQIDNRVVELETFDFNGMRLSELEKPLYAVYMFRTLFTETHRFEVDDLTRFVLTVRKNYRRVPYHNWAHGWSVAHAMFVLITKNKDMFTPLEALALYVSCLCHDLDHRGKNNAYMKTLSTPLAAIYTTSVMEHHHFNQTVTILQQDGHNILKSLSSEDYKKTLSLIKHCILATDLALFFANKAKLTQILKEDAFDINHPEHRLLTQAILMTGCDLAATAKPWSIQTETVKVIYEEFYEQGDAERQRGRDPIPMMDRNQAHQLPQMQVGFMRGICMPCYEVMAKVLPAATAMYERCEYNAKKWEELAEEQKQRDEQKKAEES